MGANYLHSLLYGFPGITAAIIGVFCVLVLSKSGRKLAARIIVGSFREAVLHMPFKKRKRMFLNLFLQTQSRGQLYVKMFANPYGYQWDSIVKVDREQFQGHWFVSKVHERGGVQWAEKTAKDADLVIMYIHGGGFWLGTSLSYSSAMLRMLKQFEVHGIRTHIFCPEYRMYPQVYLPSFQEDNEKAYEYLVRDLHVDPSKIIFGGDSAGAHSVATVLMSIRDKIRAEKDATSMESIARTPLPMPKGAIMVSPWIHMKAVTPSYTFNNDRDCLPITPGDSFGQFIQNFGRMSKEEQDAELLKPYASPLFGNYEGVCPIVVTMGGCEMFASDIEQMIQRLKDCGVKVDVFRRDDAVHLWAISRFLGQNEQVWLEGISKIANWCVLTLRQ